MQPDWNREALQAGQYEPWKRLLRCLRQHERCKDTRNPVLLRLRMRWVTLRHRFWSAVCGADIPFNADIGGGLRLPHPNGVVIHPESRIGPNCTLLQQVTLGMGPKPGLPELGSGVVVGAGAKILGGVAVGDGATIGANAVVLEDVPVGATAVGIPARIVDTEKAS